MKWKMPKKSAVKLNDYVTEYVDVTCGAKQGANLSPTLFGLFIDDLAIKIKELQCGIKQASISLAQYVMPMILFFYHTHNLQTILTRLNTWCVQWCLKSIIVHGDLKSCHNPSLFMET